jgi:hypothetical protein
MKLLRQIAIAIVLLGLSVVVAEAQRRTRPTASKSSSAVSAKPKELGSTAVVLDETLSVLRVKPSLFADSVQRMRRGRTVKILGVTEADGVRFYRVSAPPHNTGWVQADAVFGRFRENDDDRLARLVRASTGFDQIELAVAFSEVFPASKQQPGILLLLGDLLEDTATKLSKDAGSRLDRREMAASAAPMHSYYLNFNMLDRYRKLGVIFLFNPNTRTYHYEGACWRELIAKFPAASEAAEAQKRVDSLKTKMERGNAAIP